MIKVLIEIEGGCVQNVITTQEAEIIIKDWDNIKEGGDISRMEPDAVVVNDVAFEQLVNDDVEEYKSNQN